jgi:hypothetical protein
VSREEVPHYYEHVAHPMDFETMEKKVRAGAYSDLDAFAVDIELIVKNCKYFNDSKSIFYKVVRLGLAGSIALR